MLVRVLLIFIAVTGSVPGSAGEVARETARESAGESAEQEVSYLLEFIAASGCIFTRNGSDHTAAEAADHLRLKYRRGRRYAPTAEDFIEHLASQSSWSGKAYTVRCGNTAETSAHWLRRALADHRRDADV
jgi:hypothetical protein